LDEGNVALKACDINSGDSCGSSYGRSSVIPYF